MAPAWLAVVTCVASNATAINATFPIIDGSLLAPLGPRRSRCHGCEQDARPGQDYLCPTCWPQLPDRTREALKRRDGHLLDRYRRLLAALRHRVPLTEIIIA